MMYREYSTGMIEVITGPMFSGKSEELIKRINILGYAKIKTLVIKSAVDKRWEINKIISRAGSSIDTKIIKDSSEIKKLLEGKDYEAIAIDEAQFFDKAIIKTVVKLANKGMKIIVSGLDLDYVGKPFEIIAQLLALADIVDKQTAVCQVCHKAATMSYRKSLKSDRVQIGNKEYEPRCRMCHYEGMKNKKTR